MYCWKLQKKLNRMAYNRDKITSMVPLLTRLEDDKELCEWVAEFKSADSKEIPGSYNRLRKTHSASLLSKDGVKKELGNNVERVRTRTRHKAKLESEGRVRKKTECKSVFNNLNKRIVLCNKIKKRNEASENLVGRAKLTGKSCDYSSSSKTSLDMHLLLHENGLRSNIIRTPQPSGSPLSGRNGNVRGNSAPYKCFECPWSGRELAHLNSHMLRHFKRKESRPSSLCGKNVSSVSLVGIHFPNDSKRKESACTDTKNSSSPLHGISVGSVSRDGVHFPNDSKIKESACTDTKSSSSPSCSKSVGSVSLVGVKVCDDSKKKEFACTDTNTNSSPSCRKSVGSVNCVGVQVCEDSKRKEFACTDKKNTSKIHINRTPLTHLKSGLTLSGLKPGDEENLRVHKLTGSGKNRIDMYECVKCSFKTCFEIQIRSHMATHGKGPPSDPKPEKSVFECKRCSECMPEERLKAHKCDPVMKCQIVCDKCGCLLDRDACLEHNCPPIPDLSELGFQTPMDIDPNHLSQGVANEGKINRKKQNSVIGENNSAGIVLAFGCDVTATIPIRDDNKGIVTTSFETCTSEQSAGKNYNGTSKLSDFVVNCFQTKPNLEGTNTDIVGNCNSPTTKLIDRPRKDDVNDFKLKCGVHGTNTGMVSNCNSPTTQIIDQKARQKDDANVFKLKYDLQVMNSEGIGDYAWMTSMIRGRLRKYDLNSLITKSGEKETNRSDGGGDCEPLVKSPARKKIISNLSSKPLQCDERGRGFIGPLRLADHKSATRAAPNRDEEPEQGARVAAGYPDRPARPQLICHRCPFTCFLKGQLREHLKEHTDADSQVPSGGRTIASSALTLE